MQNKSKEAETACRIVIADDQAFIRKGLRMFLSENPQFDIVGEAENGRLLVNLVKETSPDLALVDLSMPEMSGIEAIREIRKTNSVMRILMLTMHVEEHMFSQTLDAGADGYILKEKMHEELFPALYALLQSKLYISPSMLSEIHSSHLKAFITDALSREFWRIAPNHFK